MRYYESTDFFLRVIRFDFVHYDPDVHVKFRLLPMFHIGEPSYYKEVIRQLNQCDIVLYEGLKLPKKQWLGFRKNFKRRTRRLGLVNQGDAIHKSLLKAKLVHADLKKEEATLAWEKLHLKAKFEYQLWDPIRFLVRYRNMNRYDLVKLFMHGYEEKELAYRPYYEEGDLDNLILDQRDQKLVSTMKTCLVDTKDQDKWIGVMYGAAHMKAAGRYLLDQAGYQVAHAEFIKVFNL